MAAGNIPVSGSPLSGWINSGGGSGWRGNQRVVEPRITAGRFSGLQATWVRYARRRTGDIPVGAGSVHPTRAYFLHDHDRRAGAHSIQCAIRLIRTQDAQSDRSRQHIRHFQAC